MGCGSGLTLRSGYSSGGDGEVGFVVIVIPLSLLGGLLLDKQAGDGGG